MKSHETKKQDLGLDIKTPRTRKPPNRAREQPRGLSRNWDSTQARDLNPQLELTAGYDYKQSLAEASKYTDLEITESVPDEDLDEDSETCYVQKI